MSRNALGAAASATAFTAASYSRFSSDLQREASIVDQNRGNKIMIVQQGWLAGPAFSDHALSGSTANRPGYQALLEGIALRSFQFIVAESLDRLSRDQEHAAALYKRCEFAGIRIFTQAEGWITELHVGLKSTMSALFLKELADRTRRGLRGRIEAGASAGGISYGYRVVRVPAGEDRGGRIIDPVQAAVVARILRDYAAGLSPKAIAAALNAEGVPGPRGEGWSQSTINGNRERGTGLLNNEVYIGFLVWNRLSYVKHPDTGKRRSRLNLPNEWVVVEAAQLRLVDQTLWDAVKKRQAALDAAAKPAADGSTFQSKQRPTYLMSGLLRCGACGGGMSVMSALRVGCSNARNKGEAFCTNRRTIKREFVEATVLSALRERLMAPEVYAAFVRGFTAEWNAEQKGRAVAQDGKRDELTRLERKIANFIDTIGEGFASPGLLSALKDAEACKAALEADLAVGEAPAPRLMPNLAELYREKVAALQDALGGEDAAAAREQIRGLIDEVRLIPSPADPSAPLTIEVQGQLAAMLALGSGDDASAAVQLERQFKLVAGAGFEPAAFRL